MQQKNVVANPGLWAVLGAVRFGLASIVFFVHLSMFSISNPVLEQMMRLSAPTAVFCFLVVSGYSIAHSLARGRKQFFRRRLLRVYPLYLATIAFTVTVDAMHCSTTPVQPHNISANLVFLQTFFAAPLTSNPVLWSLAVEVACYALAPWFSQMRTQTLLGITALSAAAFVVFPRFHLGYYAYLPHGEALLFLGWAWLAGFIYYRHQDDPRSGVVLMAAMIVFTTLNPLFAQDRQHITIAAAIGLLVAGRSVAMSDRTQKIFNYLGNLSFPMYLLHVPAFCICIYGFHVKSPLALTVTGLSAAVVGRWVELALRRPAGVAMEAVTFIGEYIADAGLAAADRISIAIAENALIHNWIGIPQASET